MGKTEKGALWLDKEKCPVNDFFQYWRNVSDDDVINCLKLLTFIPIEEIEEMEKTMTGADLNKAKEILAFEVTKMVHGEDEAQKALETARNVFSGSGIDENMPTTELNSEDLTDGTIGILSLLAKTKLAPSNSEARRLVTQNGIAIDDVKVTDPKANITVGDGIIIKKGKKVYHRVVIK